VVLRGRDSLPSRLAPLPLVQTTRWPERSLQTLTTMGVRTIGDCLRLPRDGFARRFEPDMLDMLDRAVGRQSDPRENFIWRAVCGRTRSGARDADTCTSTQPERCLDELWLQKRRRCACRRSSGSFIAKPAGTPASASWSRRRDETDRGLLTND
jgi:hypothetical protein